MTIRFTVDALRSVREKRAWWEQHREKAPRLFVGEFAAVVAKLRGGTDAERQKYAARSGRTIWRILMPKTRHHVYYRLNDAEDVEILLVWNAIAERHLMCETKPKRSKDRAATDVVAAPQRKHEAVRPGFRGTRSGAA